MSEKNGEETTTAALPVICISNREIYASRALITPSPNNVYVTKLAPQTVPTNAPLCKWRPFLFRLPEPILIETRSAFFSYLSNKNEFFFEREREMPKRLGRARRLTEVVARDCRLNLRAIHKKKKKKKWTARVLVFHTMWWSSSNPLISWCVSRALLLGSQHIEWGEVKVERKKERPPLIYPGLLTPSVIIIGLGCCCCPIKKRFSSWYKSNPKMMHGGTKKKNYKILMPFSLRLLIIALCIFIFLAVKRKRRTTKYSNGCKSFFLTRSRNLPATGVAATCWLGALPTCCAIVTQRCPSILFAARLTCGIKQKNPGRI